MLQLGAIEVLRMKQKVVFVASLSSSDTSLLVTLQLPVHFLVLFKEHEGCDRVWSQSDEARHPALEDPAQALLGCDASDEAQYALLGMRTHHASLDHVHRTADCGCDETGHDRGGEMRGEIVAKVGALQKLLLEDVVTCELRCGHQDCANAVGPDAAEQAAHTFVFDHTRESVNGVLVVATLVRWKRRIVLHAHVEDVSWVACNAAQESRRRGHCDQGR